MNSQIHTLLVAHRIQDAANERLARELRRQRRDARRSVLRRRPRHGPSPLDMAVANYDR